MYFKLYLLVLFGNCGNLFFDKKYFQNLILMFSFYPENSRTGSSKNSITQELVVQSNPTNGWVAFLTLYWLVYHILSHLNGLVLDWSISLQSPQKVNHQNLKPVYEIILFLKQTVSLIHFSDTVVIIELLLWNWKERLGAVGYKLF